MTAKSDIIYRRCILILMLVCINDSMVFSQRFAAIGDYGSGSEDETAIAELIHSSGRF